MKLGKGWAPEPEPDEYSLFAIRELRMLLKNIFEYRKDSRQNDSKRSEL
jgi:hypothetical protein